MRRRCFAVLLAVMLLPLGAFAYTRKDVRFFYHGDREQKRIAVTMDDCNRIAYVEQTLDLCRELGVAITFFPTGVSVKQRDAAIWKRVIAEGHEIGNHTHNHRDLRKIQADRYALDKQLKKQMEAVNAALGYEYPMLCLRPPYGDIGKGGTNWLRDAMVKRGLVNVILWDVSNTNPDEAFKATRNGSILLYHAQKKDVACLKQLLPRLLEAGFELVTVSELVGPPPGGGDEQHTSGCGKPHFFYVSAYACN